MDEEFTALYHTFVKDWVKNNVAKGKTFWFQRTPTIRVHCPGSNADKVYPAYHNDMFLGHHAYEINIWFPFTHKRSEGHGFVLASVEESKKLLQKYGFNIPEYYKEVRDHNTNIYKETHNIAKPVTTDFGQVSVFDLRSIHSTLPMHNQTRVSMDVRIIFAEDKEKHIYDHRGKGRMASMFQEGEYFYKEPVT